MLPSGLSLSLSLSLWLWPSQMLISFSPLLNETWKLEGAVTVYFPPPHSLGFDKVVFLGGRWRTVGYKHISKRILFPPPDRSMRRILLWPSLWEPSWALGDNTKMWGGLPKTGPPEVLTLKVIHSQLPAICQLQFNFSYLFLVLVNCDSLHLPVSLVFWVSFPWPQLFDRLKKIFIRIEGDGFQNLYMSKQKPEVVVKYLNSASSLNPRRYYWYYLI